MPLDPDILQLTNELNAKRNPSPEERFQLLQLYHDRELFEEAIELCQELVTSHRNFLPGFIAMGDLCLEGGLYEEACKYYLIVFFEDAEQMDLAARLRFALCNYHLGKVEMAEELLEEMVDQHQEFEPAYRLLLGIYQATGDRRKERLWVNKLKRARASFERSLTLGTYLR